MQLYLVHTIYVYDESLTENRAHRKQLRMTFGILRNRQGVLPED